MEIEDGGAADVQGETAYLTHHFACAGRIPIILSAPRNKLSDDVSVQFIRHVPQKIADGNAGLAKTPLVHDTVGIIVEDLLLKGIEGLVEFEPSMARGESCYEDIGFGAFNSIVLDTGVNGLQDVVGTEAEGADIESSVGDETEQMGGVPDSNSRWFVDTLAEFAPETVQHQFGGSLASRIFGNAGNIQSDPLPFLVTKNVVPFLLHGLTPTGPPRRLLFDLQPCVDVISKKTRPALLGGKMPDFVDLDQGLPLFHGFDQLGRAPGPT